MVFRELHVKTWDTMGKICNIQICKWQIIGFNYTYFEYNNMSFSRL